MKVFILVLVLLSESAFASQCIFKGKNLDNLGQGDEFELQFSIQVPAPPDFLKILEKYFGKFTRPECKNSITATKIINRNTSEYYLAFYTNEYRCDGGNSYGVIFRGTDAGFKSPVATIEDSYIDCL